MSTALQAAERLLRVREVAARLGVRQGHVLAWLRAGTLRGYDVSAQIGGRPRWRIDPADLEAFLLLRASPAAPRRVQRRKRMNGITEFF